MSSACTCRSCDLVPAWEKRWTGGDCGGLDRLPSVLSENVNHIFDAGGGSFFTAPTSLGLARHGWLARLWFWSGMGLWLGRPFGRLQGSQGGCVLDWRGLRIISDLTRLGQNWGIPPMG